MNIEDLKGCFANINDDELLRENGLLYAENKELKSEIERLNNIINELEKWLNEVIDDEDITRMELAVCQTILRKLKELKENK